MNNKQATTPRYSQQAERQAPFDRLPLSPFEQYMIVDDRPEFPMTYEFLISVAGLFDRPALEAAIAESLLRHPLLTCLLHQTMLKAYWVYRAPARSVIQWHTMPHTGPVTRHSIDLTKEPGFRASVREWQGNSEVSMVFHHAIADGVGSMSFLKEVWRRYARRIDPDSAPVPQDTDLSLLSSRHSAAGRRLVFRDGVPQPPPGLRKRIAASLKEVWTVMTRQPVPISRHRANPPASLRTARTADGAPVAVPDADQTRSPVTICRTMDPATTRTLRECSRRLQISLNDLLLGELMLALDHWNQQQNAASGGALRLLMPVNVRGTVDQQMSASNGIGYAFVTRERSELADHSALFRSIRAETTQIKQDALAWTFIDTSTVLQKLRPLHKLMVRHTGRQCLSTAVLSNLGDITDLQFEGLSRTENSVIVGNVAVMSVNCSPPIRPFTRAAVLCHTFCDQLVVNLGVDQQQLRKCDAEELLEHFVSRLRHRLTTPAQT